MFTKVLIDNLLTAAVLRRQRQLGHLIIINPLIATLIPHSNGPSYSNTVIGTLAVDGCAVTFGTARRRLGGAAARPSLSSPYQM